MILSNIKTKQDLDYFIEQIDTLNNSLYRTRSNVVVPEIIKAEFDTVGGDAKSREKFLEQIKKQLSAARFLEMKIPIQLGSASIDKISAFVKQNIGEDLVLDLVVDPDVMAGAELTFNGKFKDYSLKQTLEKEIYGAI